MAGQFLFHTGRYPEAIEALDKAFSIDPGFWVAHVMMGQIYEQSGKPEAAIQSFDKAYRSSSGATVALSYKGYVLANSGRRAAAEFLTVDPKWNDLRSDSRFQELVKRCHFVLSR